jgi:predicted transglutaminase-like cysteine proteinase
MSNLHQARRAAPLFAIGLSVGLLACLANAGSQEVGAPPSETFEYKLASAAPFEPLRDAPDSRLSEPFGLDTSALVTSGLQNNVQNKWGVVAKELPHEHEILLRCRADADACPPAAKRFLAILAKAQTRSGLARIGEINRAINLTIKWVDDMTQYGVRDLWVTPLMTFASEAGNCKHYAIAKYVALHEIGIATDDLRLVVVRDRPTNQLHAVTAVRYDGRWLILDNRTFIMAQDVDIQTYNPLFVLDTDGVKRAIPETPKPQNPNASVSAAAMGPQFTSGWQSTPLLL